MLQFRRALTGSTALLAAMVVPGIAQAQSQLQAGGDATQPSQTAQDAPRDREIIVTGSRLVTNGNSSPTPVTVATVDDLLRSQPAGVIEGLATLPALMGSNGQTSNNNSGGVNTLNLRGIGSLRTLILIDGRRIGPTQTDGTIDVDVIPQVLLKHVDVVTGGASAAYGSDAVSGVVNFVTDTEFTGFKGDIHGGISKYGDDPKFGVRAAWGTKFSDGRGHFEIGLEYTKDDGFLRSSRPFLNNYSTLVGQGTTASPFTLLYGTKLNTASYGGLITSGALAGLQFAQNGTLSTFNKGTPTLSASVSQGGDGASYQGSTAGAANTSYRSMARLDYEVTDTIKAHTSLIFSKFRSAYTGQNPLLNNYAIGYNNAYLSSVQPQYQAIIAAQPAGSTFNFSKVDLTLPNYGYNWLSTYYNADAGLDGKLGRFSWQADYYRADSIMSQRSNNAINLNKFYAAIDAVNVGGKTVCHAALTNSNFASCVPLNLFGSSTDQADAINYIEQANTTRLHYTTNDVSANIKGTLFNLPAGPVQAVLVGEWRKLSYAVATNGSSTDPVDCNGIEYNCNVVTNPQRYLGGGSSNVPKVSESVKEFAAEVDVPILTDKHLFKSLSVNGAARYTDYQTSGGVWTWKGGVVWNVSDELTLRATRSRDIRAPTLTDLFYPTSINQNSYTDLHTNTTNTVIVATVSNPNLTPEKADTWTIGAVVKPRFLPGFSLAVDYYNINITNALASIQATQASTQAACEASAGTAPVCSLFVRPYAFSNTTAANFPTMVYNETLNVASVSSHGIDVEANYNTSIASHRFGARMLVTYQPTLKYNLGPAGIVDVAGAADGIGGLSPIPKVKLVANVNYDVTDRVHFGLQERWRASFKQNGIPTLVYNVPNIPSIGYTDLNMSVDIAKNFTGYVNIQNLFNTWPKVFDASGASTQMNYSGGYAPGDDIEGRYFMFGLRYKM